MRKGIKVSNVTQNHPITLTKMEVDELNHHLDNMELLLKESNRFFEAGAHKAGKEAQ